MKQKYICPNESCISNTNGEKMYFKRGVTVYKEYTYTPEGMICGNEETKLDEMSEAACYYCGHILGPNR